MKVRIKNTSKSDIFGLQLNGIKLERLNAGEVVEYSKEQAAFLRKIYSFLEAEKVEEPKKVEEEVEEVEEEVVEEQPEQQEEVEEVEESQEEEKEGILGKILG